jgi:hypothetical protein
MKNTLEHAQVYNYANMEAREKNPLGAAWMMGAEKKTPTTCVHAWLPKHLSHLIEPKGKENLVGRRKMNKGNGNIAWRKTRKEGKGV